jgi:hypothetical protein
VRLADVVPHRTLTSAESTTRFACQPDRPLIEQLRSEVTTAQCPADLSYLRHAILPWLTAVAGPLDAAHEQELDTLMDARRTELDGELRNWDERLAAVHPLAGAWADLWQAVTSHDVERLIAASARLMANDAPEPVRAAIPHVLASARDRATAGALIAVIQAIALGDARPDGIVRALVGMSEPAAVVARALVDDVASDCEGTEAQRQALLDAVRIATLDDVGFWRVHDAVGTLGEAWAAFRNHDLVAQLASILGLDQPREANNRRYVYVTLGDAFIPEDTGESWVLFSDYIPALRARIESETGFTIPGFGVRRDRLHRPPGLVQLLFHEVIRATFYLPTDGAVARVPGASSQHHDPLTDEPVVHIPPGAPVPEGVTEMWQPLEYVMRHVEYLVRQNLAETVTVWDAASRTDTPFSTADELLRSLEEYRRSVSEQVETREPVA